MSKNIAFGLDFGTTTTLVAIPGNQWPEILRLGTVTNFMPSVLSSNNGDDWQVGENADAAPLDEQFLSPKSLITFDSESITNGLGITISKEEAIKSVLKEVNNRLSKDYPGLLGSGKVRMSCPAIWTGPQRSLLAKYATECGLVTDVDEILDEPISAGIAWWWDKNIKSSKKSEGKALVFDLGGGTLDVAVLDIYNYQDYQPQFTVLAARGTDIAGDKVDKIFADYIEARLVNEENFKLPTSQDLTYLRAVLRRTARECKEKLSLISSVRFEVDKRYATLPSFKISRVDFEHKIFDTTLQRSLSCTKAALKEAVMKQKGARPEKIKEMDITKICSEINFVILAGGMSQIPCIGEELQKLMPNAQVEFVTTQSEANEGIVLGVANNNDFESLNIHRPGFDFILKWKEKNGAINEKVMYRAFTPLYSDVDINQGNFKLGFQSERWVPKTDLQNNSAELSIRSVGGREVKLKFGDEILNNAIKLTAYRNTTIDFKIYIDGTIIVEDSVQKHYYRVREWPFIRLGVSSQSDPELFIEKTDGTEYKFGGYEMWRE
jgi:molecular chaperone DnaK (HSP70)